MNTIPKLNRRSFLVASAAAGGGLALGFHLPGRHQQAEAAVSPEVNAWIVISPDDSVTIRVAMMEMGQGSSTGLPMLVAEELACDWSKVKMEMVSAHENLARGSVYGSMFTVGSRSIRTSHEKLRMAGATGREMLIEAAARNMGVSATECSAFNSVVTHTPSGRSVTYGQVASAAAKLSPPTDVKLKDPKDWTLLGTPQRRFDIADKVAGKPVYAIDARPEGVVYAAILHSPVFGGTLKSFDADAIAGRKGIHKVVQVGDSAIAVIADSYWQAQRALDAMPVTWNDNGNGGTSNADIAAHVASGLTADDAGLGRSDGDTIGALKAAAKIVEAEYSVPFLSHAPMEPINCTAHVTNDGVDIWTSTQGADGALQAAARTAGVDPSKVRVHVTMCGGGFGRRGAQDFLVEAVTIAKTMDRPVQLIWSREEDIRHDFYRPISSAKLTAGLDSSGKFVAFNTRIAGQSLMSTQNPAALEKGVDLGFMTGFTDIPYEIENILVDYGMRNTHVPVGYWRSVNHSQNGFFREGFIDEVAHAAGEDPYQFRRKMLANEPKQLAVLDAAAKKADWGSPLPEGVGRGIALVDAYGSIVAAVAEASMDKNGKPVLHRVVCAVDSGHVVNPATVETQIEGSIVWGLSAALYGKITIDKGRVEQGNFDTYPMVKLAEMPKVEVVLVPSGGFWGGAGEPGVPPLAPALTNAIFAASGKRIRSLPIIDLSGSSA